MDGRPARKGRQIELMDDAKQRPVKMYKYYTHPIARLSFSQKCDI